MNNTAILNTKKRELASFLLSFLYLFSGGYGIMLSLIGIVKLDLDILPVIAGLFLLSLLFTLFFQASGWYRGISGVLLASVLIKGFYLLDQQRNGLLYFCDYLISAVNRYFNTSYYLVYQIQENKEDLLLAIIAVTFVMLALLSLCIICIPNIIMYLVLSVPAIGGGLLLGSVPDLVPMLFWTFCGLGILFRILLKRGMLSNQKNKIKVRGNLRGLGGKTECLFAFSSILLLGVIACASKALIVNNPISDQVRNAVYSGITKHIWSELKSWKTDPLFGLESVASGGINGGELGNADKFVFNGETALLVTVNERPTESIYLKSYVGSKYTGNNWTNPKREEYEARFITGNSGHEDTDKIHNLFYDICSREMLELTGKQKGMVKMSIEWKEADKAYAYIPYISNQKDLSPEDFEREQDAYIRNKNSSLTAYELSYYSKESFQKIQNAVLDSYGTELGALESDYRNYVYQAYLDIPNSGIPKLKDEFQGIVFSDTESAARFIRETLHERTKYNLNVGKLPDGRDFAEYFLYEQKEGSCTHYAATAALMFRLFGIPARYAVGYIAPPSAFSENKDGTFTAVLQDNKAHAWPEIYINGFGWMPEEVTPGYMVNSLSTENVISEEAILEKEKSGPSVPPVISTASTESEKGKAKPTLRSQYSNSFLQSIAILVIIITAVPMIRFRRWLILKKRRDSFHGKDYNDNIKKIYRAIQDIHVFIKIPSNAEGIEPLFLEACYSNHVLSQEDCDIMENHYDQLRRGVRDHLGYLQKFLFQYYKCLG